MVARPAGHAELDHGGQDRDWEVLREFRRRCRRPVGDPAGN
jgi:hypothetical protein